MRYLLILCILLLTSCVNKLDNYNPGTTLVRWMITHDK